MGNTPSSPSPTNRPRRLSKPPTYTSSSNLLAIASKQPENALVSPVSTPARSIEDDPLNSPPQAQQMSRQDTRQKFRSQLFRRDTDSPTRGSLEDDNERRNSFGGLVNGVKRLSRSGSLVSQNPSAGGSAIQLVSPVGASRLSLVPEGTAADLESDRTVQEIKEKAEMDGRIANASKRFSSIPENDEVEALLSPIRRRSLFTPGLATRGGDILRKPPPSEYILIQKDRDYYFDPHHSESSPLGKLAALDLAGDGRRSPIVRTETPCDLDYSQLGAIKLGTLRIMNGAASPAPSDRTHRLHSGSSTPDLRHKEDYFTASGGLASDEVRVNHQTRKVSSEEPYVHPRAAWKTSEMATPGFARFGSPLKYQRAPDSSDGESLAMRPVNPESKLRPILLSDRPALSPEGATSIAQEYTPELGNISTGDALKLAQEYISELGMSPFSKEPTPAREDVPTVQVTSKASEYDDMLFEDEGVSTSPSEEMDLPSFETLPKSASTWQIGVNSAYEASEDNDYMTMSALPHLSALGTPLSKTDSGYSSSASLRSVRNAQSSRSIDSRDSEPKPSVSEKKSSLPDIREDPNLNRGSIVQPQPEAPARASILVKPKPKAQLPAPLADVHRPSSESIQTSASASSNLTSSSTGPKKLQKPRPRSQPPPAKYITVQGHRELSQSHIPPVPSEIALRHAERLRAFPLLEHTYPSLNHTRSNETMSTSSIPPCIPIRFPSPTRYEDESPPKPPPHRYFKSIRASKSEKRASQQLASVNISYASGISDLGTLGDSLGVGPYDAARPSIQDTSRGVPRSQLAHPHQISSTAPRTKPFSGMDAHAAADLARLRSKTLAERQHLPFTLKQILFDDRGGIPGKQLKARNAVDDLPALPPVSNSRDQVHHDPLKTSEGYIESRGKRTSPADSGSDQVSGKLMKARPPSMQNLAGVDSSPMATVDFDRSWEPHRQAWSMRRKSAGDGLLAKRVVSDELDHSAPYSSGETATAARSLNPAVVEVTAQRPPRISPSPTYPGPEVKLGRYDGGLGYGFEPSYGVGGSAGTRSLQNDASRKGVDVSMGYGVDFSDVPIIRGIKH